MHGRIGRSLLLTAVLAAVTAVAWAQPANDNWSAREVIAALPFADTEALIGSATVEGTDPQVLCRGGVPGQGGNSVWYSYTTAASVEYLNLSTATSGYDTMVTIYTGSTAADLRLVAGGCNDDGVASVFQSRVNGLRLQPSTTYSIGVTRFSASATATTLNFSVTAAPQYNVSKTADTADGTCDADCSLREAITASNATPGAVLIPAGTYTLSLAGSGEENNATGDLDIRSGMGIYGAGVGTTTVDAADLDRVLHVDPPTTSNRVTAILAGLTLTNGTVTGDGGGILAAGTGFLALDGVAVTNNLPSGSGGGLRTPTRATIWNSTIQGNTAAVNGGGLSLAGAVDITVEVRNSTISGNTAQAATLGGGGIHSTARLRVINSTLSTNRANFGGGGILQTSTGSVVISSSTIVGNFADADSNNSGQGGGVRLESSSTASSITNTVIANNIDNSTTAPAPDCSRTAGTIASTRNHVEAVGSCAFFVGTGDVTGSDPALDASLAANGGPTQTHMVLAGSPLIDAGDPAGCADYLAHTLPIDQRQGARAVDGDGNASMVCDKGAVEFMNGAPVDLLEFAIE